MITQFYHHDCDILLAYFPPRKTLSIGTYVVVYEL